MVFYHPLPVEIWFIIYKMEHSMFLKDVNCEIKTLSKQMSDTNHKIQNYLWAVGNNILIDGETPSWLHSTSPLYNFVFNESRFKSQLTYGLFSNINEWIKFKKTIKPYDAIFTNTII